MNTPKPITPADMPVQLACTAAELELLLARREERLRDAVVADLTEDLLRVRKDALVDAKEAYSRIEAHARNQAAYDRDGWRAPGQGAEVSQ